jgi:site-specific recombinase XerD
MVTEKLVWHVVKEFAAKIGVSKLAPHDLRRSCARLCRAAGGELEQIQFLLGHVSVRTTEDYLGCTQRISSAVNDRHRDRAEYLNDTFGRAADNPLGTQSAYQRTPIYRRQRP